MKNRFMKIYCDSAATTPMNIWALLKALPYCRDKYYNPNSKYISAIKVQQKVEQARSRIAHFLGADPNEIYFTSGGAEGDNWAIKGSTVLLGKRKGEIVISPFEHAAVQKACVELEQIGYKIVTVPVDEEGKIILSEYINLLSKNTLLVSIMMANNEIGTIQDIKTLASIAHQKGILFHCDGTQAVGSVPINLKELSVDLFSFSAHKFGGPKGVGVMYIREGVTIAPLINGGEQEREQRGGTTNVFGIIATSVALYKSLKKLTYKNNKLSKKINYINQKLVEQGVELVGPKIGNERLPGNLSYIFPCGGSLVFLLDQVGIEASNGSACSSAYEHPPASLVALGREKDSLRFVRISLKSSFSWLKTLIITRRLKTFIQKGEK